MDNWSGVKCKAKGPGGIGRCRGHYNKGGKCEVCGDNAVERQQAKKGNGKEGKNKK